MRELAIIEKLVIRYSYISDSRFTKTMCTSGISLFMPETDQTGNDFYNTFVLEESQDATEVSRFFLWDNFIKIYMKKKK